jgi:hypothetical protein
MPLRRPFLNLKCHGNTEGDAATLGYETYLIEDLCRTVSQDSGEAMRGALDKQGVQIVTAQAVKDMLAVGSPLARTPSECTRAELDSIEEKRTFSEVWGQKLGARGYYLEFSCDSRILTMNPATQP